MNTTAAILALSCTAILAVPAAAQTNLCFAITQGVGGDTFGARSAGQSFTPNVGLVPAAGSLTALPLTQMTFYQGNLGGLARSATTYLNIYDGDPNGSGTFIGSSVNAVDTTTLTFHTPMTWTFNLLVLNAATEHWAVMSSTNAAGNLDIEVSLETEPRNGPPGPDVYTGGAGLIANIAQHPASVDARFEAQFALVPPGSFTLSGVGCAGSGGVPTLSAVGGATPRVGEAFGVECANLPLTAATAFASISYSAFTPAVDLTVIGMPGCTLYTPLTIVVAQPVAGGIAQFTVTPPVSLAGFTLYYQWVVADPGANALGLIVSDLGVAVLGC